MNNAQMSARVGLFFLIGVALLWITYEALNGGSFSHKKGYVVTASFATLKELKPGDDVRQAGVKIGTVSSTRLSDSRAEAVLLIDDQTHIAKDATASIAMAGMLGGGYISLDFGTPRTALDSTYRPVPRARQPRLRHSTVPPPKAPSKSLQICRFR